MLNYQTWLETQNVVRILLIQIIDVRYTDPQTSTVSKVTKYISSVGVTVDGQEYLGILKGTFNLTERINLDYSANINYGDISIYNGNGAYDDWLSSSFVWAYRTVKVYVGELPKAGTTSTISDFEQVFEGLVSDIDSKDRFTISFKVRDKLENLNISISETLLGNYYNGAEDAAHPNTNSTALRPVCFGEVFNVTPLLSDPANLHYMVNSVPVELILEVRDNGVPVQFTPVTTTPATGSFRLLQAPVGTITCSVQGTKRIVNTSNANVSNGYSPTASNTILEILLEYSSKAETRASIDLPSFAALGTQSIGVYLTDRANVLQVCQDIARSCGLAISITRLGKVRLVDVTIPTTSTWTITESDILLNSLMISQRPEVIAGVKLGFSKNYTQQPNLLTAIPQQHKDFYASDYTESSARDTNVKTAYTITVEPPLEPTYLIDSAEADAVATKKLNLFKVPRKVYKMTGTAKLLSVQIGDGVLLSGISRFGLSSSKGLVVSTTPDWLKGTIDLEVLV